MKISKIFLLSSIAFIAIACQDKKDEPKPTPTPGEEVNFGGELVDYAGSRTIYGDEQDKTGNWYFPILWLETDKVFISSPQCREDFNQGTFGVPSTADHKEYAGSFIKESGAIQWGSTATADFYSIYPQRNEAGYEVKTSNDYSATNATFDLNMPETQFCDIAGANPTMTSADMRACFMYARTTDVDNGEPTVMLQYKPLSTAIRFTLRGPDPDLSSEDEKVSVARIRLVAPSGTPLTGKFKVNLTGETPVVEAVSGQTSNVVTVYAQYSNGAYLELAKNQSIELNAFIIPVNNLTINENWKLEVDLANGTTVTKKLKAATTTSNPTPNTNIVAGKIHRLGNMPFLPPGELDPSRWLEFIPRNVYLSEISIPGSWNSLNKDFQTMSSGTGTEQISKNTIDAQYNAGCRFFHIDTRFRRINATSTNFTNLGIANGGDGATVLFSGGKQVMKEDACPLFSEALGYITANVKTQEFMVVLCTFAQDSYEGADWRQKVSDACASNTAVYDASQITQNTTVGDVLGKVIVIIATEDAVTTSYSGSKCLFVQLPNKRTSGMYPTTAGYFDTQTIYHGGKATSGITLNCTQAQISSYNSTAIPTNERGYAPTMTQRQTIGGNILDWAKTNYAASGYAHNCWMYQGLGGYKVTNRSADTQSGSYTAIANEMGAWISEKIDDMDASTGYYPVGMLLMNFVNTNATSLAAVDDILQLNNKFHKAYDPDKPAWPGQGSQVQSAAPGYDSGMKDNNQNAISGN
ncbi:MAG: hypothetical protein HUJ98_04390 [Bacteroidaceae bacterium]|nr:hypothetical protein [Bacteroidaceae bacterium]